MIKYELMKVFNWFDIAQEIANQVGVKDLHGNWFDPETNKIVKTGEGEYRNFWHIALRSIIPDNMSNDSIVTMFNIENWDVYAEWTKPYFQVYHNIMLEIDPDDEGVLVNFSW